MSEQIGEELDISSGFQITKPCFRQLDRSAAIRFCYLGENRMIPSELPLAKNRNTNEFSDLTVCCAVLSIGANDAFKTAITSAFHSIFLAIRFSIPKRPDS